MAAAKKKHAPNAIIIKEDSYIPFKARFLAWWEGVDPEFYVLRQKGLLTEQALTAGSIITELEAGAPGEFWTPTRLALIQRLWEPEGEMLQPGGAKFSFELVKPMALNSEKTALDLSSNLGGGTRLIAKELDLWIVGMEPSEELASKAQELSKKHGMEKRAPISHYSSEDFTLPEKKYDGILARETLYTHRNKSRSFDVIYKSLKPGGHFVTTDYVLRNEQSADHRTIEKWLSLQDRDTHLWTMHNMKRLFLDKSMDLRIFEDQTEKFHSMILSSWQAFVDSLERKDLTREFVDLLMEEAEYWLATSRALESGELIYIRSHAMRGRDRI